jgi:hypothetical protein
MTIKKDGKIYTITSYQGSVYVLKNGDEKTFIDKETKKELEKYVIKTN